MKDFIISTDSTADLPVDFYEEKNIPVLSLSYIVNGKTYLDIGGLTSEELMEEIRNGAMPTTSQVNPEQAQEMFESFVKEGVDVLHISFTSGLSGSYNSEVIAKMELEELYPDCRIEVVDSLCASMGQGLLLYKVIELKENGKSMDEILTWIEMFKNHICHNVAIDDLHHLHRGGRVSKTSAVIGSLINIKPILHINDEGRLVVINKIRGRKKSLAHLLDKMEQQMKGYDNDVAMIVHGDVPEEAEYLKTKIQERFGIEKVIINGIGSVIGSHTGPGVIATFFVGDKEK